MADLLRREEEFYASLFDSPKGGDAVKSRGQMIERKIEVLEDMATKVSNRRSRRWLNDRLLIELVPRLHVEEIKGLFAPPPWGLTVWPLNVQICVGSSEELPVSAFCRTSDGEWDAFRSIDMDVEARLMQQMKQSSAKQKNHVDSDELIALNAWHRIDRQTREAIKRNFLPDLLDIYEVCLSFSLIVLFKPIAILFVFLFATMVTRFV
uniref:R3H-associated N-terminal domain-containing protein n=1 Tax=Oryza glumipatula TaxID=40148 RepID=A0A0E0BNV7_9ORYZ